MSSIQVNISNTQKKVECFIIQYVPLKSKSRKMRLVRRPNSVGIVDDKLPRSMPHTVRLDKRAISLGMVPTKLLSPVEENPRTIEYFETRERIDKKDLDRFPIFRMHTYIHAQTHMVQKKERNKRLVFPAQSILSTKTNKTKYRNQPQNNNNKQQHLLLPHVRYSTAVTALRTQTIPAQSHSLDGARNLCLPRKGSI